jgi:helicase
MMTQFGAQLSLKIKERVITLTPPQSEILATGILESGFSCVLQMPTGSGKTWLAEKIIEETVSKDFRAIFLTPLRALAEELYTRWQEKFPSDFKIGIFTGDYGSTGKERLPVSFKDAQILIMTPERLDLITRNWRSHWNWLPEVDLLVTDEIHLLGERSRGARLEGALSRFRRLNPFARMIGLSATMGNRGELADWLEGVEFGSDWRPVPLTWKLLRYRKATEKPAMLCEVVKETITEGGQSLVFVQSRRRAENLCRELCENGVSAGHHHAGLTRRERNQTEAGFREGNISVLVTTSTLEMGINLPARQVVLYDLQEFNGMDFRPLSVNTVWQRAGRAGRYGIDEKGEVVLLASAWDKIDDYYEKGNFEPILSVLNNQKMIAEQILAEVQSGLARTDYQLKSAFAGSLAAFQNRLPNIGAAVKELIKSGMLVNVRSDQDDNEIVDKIGNKLEDNAYRLKVTPLGKIGVRHLLYPATILLFRKALESTPGFSFFDLLLIVASSEDCQPRLPVDYEELDELVETLARESSLLLQYSTEEVFEILGISGKRLLSALKMALTLRCWTMEGDIQKVAEACNCYPFEVERLAQQAARLLQAMREIILLNEDVDNSVELADPYQSERDVPLAEKLNALHRMVEMGLDEQTATLTFIKGIGARTARRLSGIGCVDIEDLAGIDPEELAQEKGISENRARSWRDAASSMQKQYSAFYFRESKTSRRIQSGFEFPAEIDPYRLRRALELKVSGEDGGIYRVTGGLEPHLIKLKNEQFSCDCIDAEKGNVCKHVLAVRLLRGDKTLKKLAAHLQNPDSSQPIDLLALWMGS